MTHVKLRSRRLSWLIVLTILSVSVACNIPSLTNQAVVETTIPTDRPTDIPEATETPFPTPTPTPEPEVRIDIGEQALGVGDFDSASEEFDSVLGESDDQRTVYAATLGQAKTAFLEGNQGDAIEIAEPLLLNQAEIKELSDLVSATYFLLGQAYYQEERYLDAAGAYASYLELRPGIIDAYVHDLIGDSLFAGGEYFEAVKSYTTALEFPGSFDRTFIEMKLARSLALNSEYEAALEKYEQIYQRTDNENTKALIHLRKGQVYTQLDELDQAYNEYLRTVDQYPTAYESYSALLALVEAGVPVNELNRGLVDFFAGEYGAALAAFNRYLINNPPDPGTAHYYIGISHRYGGRYDEALAAWDILIQDFPDHPYWDEAWEQKGFTQWFYMDDYDAAIETLLGFVDASPTHPRAPEFMDDAARAAERSGDLALAAKLWKDLTMNYTTDERAANSLFLSSLSYYRLGRYDEALQGFQGTLGISQTLSDKSRALLWIGKTHEQLENVVEAEKAIQEASSVDPTGYYSERARDLILGRDAFTHPGMVDFAYDHEGELNKASAWMKTTFQIADETNLIGLGSLEEEPSIIRANELWRLGLKEEAKLEFETLRQALLSDPELTFRLAQHFSQIGLHRSAAFAARRVLDMAGMDDASSLTAPTFFSRLRFPILFTDLILPAAAEYQIHPLLILSLIRQESLFESFALSSASAQGLMQIIPSTGEEIALDLGMAESFIVSDLNRPYININFGTYYLSKQIDYFNGDIYAALAAYNGGPGNSAQWLDLAPEDSDLFLEVIRYAETRLYIRRIYEIFSIYKRLYDRTP